MRDTNIVIQVGRLTRDSELAYTQSGYALLKFAIAVNRTKKQGDQYTDEPSFFDVVLFGKMGESIVNYMTKGKQVCVTGELEQQRWEKDGQKRSKIVINAQTVQLLGSKDSGQSSGNPGQVSSNTGQLDPAAPTPGQTPRTMSGPPPTNFDDDVPF